MPIQVKISKNGIDVNKSQNPNDFIFHSDYNTFKIIKTGTRLTQSVTANPTTFTVAHGFSFTPIVYGFCKFPDGYVAMPGEKERADAIPIDRMWNIEVDATNIYFSFTKGASNYNVDLRYYVFESALSGDAIFLDNQPNVMITKEGGEASSEDDLSKIAFSSNYGTLKYKTSGYVDITTSGSGAETTITHGLGYVPFFTAFVNGFAMASSDNYNMCPGAFSDFGFYGYAYAYADTDKLYFRIETNSLTATTRFYYKVFTNNVGL